MVSNGDIYTYIYNIYTYVIYLYISFLEWMFYYFSGGVYHFFCWQELANCGRQLGEAGMFGTSLKKSSKKSTFFGATSIRYAWDKNHLTLGVAASQAGVVSPRAAATGLVVWKGFPRGGSERCRKGTQRIQILKHKHLLDDEIQELKQWLGLGLFDLILVHANTFESGVKFATCNGQWQRRGISFRSCHTLGFVENRGRVWIFTRHFDMREQFFWWELKVGIEVGKNSHKPVIKSYDRVGLLVSQY